MIKHAWSLVFFTVLGQMGAGLYLIHKLAVFYNRLFSSGVQQSSKKLLIVSLALSVLALFVSFSHLGHPKNAIFALSNFKNSWLSREIFFLAAFVGIMIIEHIFKKWLTGSFSVETAISIIGIIASLAFVYSMIRLYQLKTVPVWNSGYTFLNFYNSALLFGTLIILLNSTFKSNHVFIYMAFVLLISQVLILSTAAHLPIKTSFLPLLFYSLVFVSLIVSLLGAIPDRGKILLSILSILFFSLGILTERYLFYSSFKNVGI